MSWVDELHKIFEYNNNQDFQGVDPMPPISHSTATAQIQISITETGDFKGASEVDKNGSKTIIPVTEGSAARSGRNPPPHPFADKLKYIAGDYNKYVEGKDSDNSKCFTAYMEQLHRWLVSEHTNTYVKALYTYLEKKQVMSDLIKSDVLAVDNQSNKLLFKKISGIPQENAFVRFIVYTHDDLIKTWEDKRLQESFIAFNRSLLTNEKQLCYASGKILHPTYKNPYKIRNTGDKAKLISANDRSGFTYRGRFLCKEQAFSISYEVSQKIHNALRWLIERQGETIDSLTIVVWASSLQNIHNVCKKTNEEDDWDYDNDEDDIPTTAPEYINQLKKRIYGFREKLIPNTKVMLMGLDSSGIGRLNISFYSELDSSQYLNNIEDWYKNTAWHILGEKGENKKNYIKFNIHRIIEHAFGTEIETKKGAFINCDEKLKKDNIIRLLPCITEHRAIPKDIVRSLYFKASNPLAYKDKCNHRKVLETACGMIRKQRIDIGKGDVSMAYDPNEKDRSYLYGCLLAIADKAESHAYNDDERNNRVTNARRYWSAFSQHPYQTWRIIEEKLLPYMDKLGKTQVLYAKWINEITKKMTPADFCDNRRLEPMYLIGYHHFTDYMYTKSNSKEEE